MEETKQIQIIERKDSIEIGTPAKGGAVKIYFDAEKPEEAKKLIDNASLVKGYAIEKLSNG